MLRTEGRPDGRSGPTTRPALAKAMQVKIAMSRLPDKDNRAVRKTTFIRSRCNNAFNMRGITE